MKRLLAFLLRRRHPYEPLIQVEISADRLIHNLEEFRKMAPNGVLAPVLKSNAYGHGLVEVARILETENSRSKRMLKSEYPAIPFFVIDSYFEALALRSAGIKTPLLIIGYAPLETMLASRLKDISFTVTSLEALETLSKSIDGSSVSISKPLRIHLKIDTGMHRQGILLNEIGRAIDLMHANEKIFLEGICSHLSDADNGDSAFTQSQIAAWNKSVERFKSAFPSLRYIHLSNTDGHRFSTEITANVSRLGLGLYGIVDGASFKPALNLLPALEMKTTLTGVKKIRKGEHVGYSNTFTAPKDMTIATIPAGYFEGIDRRLSNVGFVLVGERQIPCPIIGRVSMNITVIDVSKVPEAKIGTRVLLISNTSTDPNSIRNIAKACGTIAYEIAVHVPAHLKRSTVGTSGLAVQNKKV